MSYIAGVAEYGGCPAIRKFKAADIQFIAGSAKPTSKAVKKREMLENLNKYPDIKLTIEGHTDTLGKPDLNQTLSLKKGEAVKAAIVKKE